ncbi:MAG: class I SAM-dependent methyltransferase [Halomonas sp.]|uniref:class I SAM-dependent methyltransferase n=1 Tax=Halomonas sp. TaxID=1486246 RepID=UPI003F901D8D
MPTATSYQTALHYYDLPGQLPLALYSLLDKQQYYDPTGAAERLGICSAAWPLFGMVWPSGMLLAKKMAKAAVAPGQRILEIGCGLAVASLVAHRQGKDVTASDRHPMAGHFLSKNLAKNRLPPMDYRYGQWGCSGPASQADTGAPPLSGRYDLIMGSDLLYEPDSPAEVASFIDAYAQAESEVWITDANRGYRSRFNRYMAEHGFSLVKDKPVRRPLMYARSGLEEPYSGRFLLYRRSL